MDLNFTPEEQAFRAEVQQFLREQLPEALAAKVKAGQRLSREDQSDWHARLNARGWYANHWPEEHGGPGWTPVQKFIFDHECALAGGPRIVPFGVNMLGPVLIKYGNEAQKSHWLPRILSGEDWWCQGYSEPGAGSDLASVKTTAVRGVDAQGDHYIVNGQKTWTTQGQHANMIFCLVRTDRDVRPQAGISFLLIDMASAGVSTRPIKLISGKSPFCETFLDAVKVPRANLVGELNAGWTIAKYLLLHEREMIGAMGERASPPSVGASAAQCIGRDADGRLDDAVLRAEIARFEVDEAAFRAWITLVAKQAGAGEAEPAISSALKYYGAELNKRRWELMMAIGGADALEWDGRGPMVATAAQVWLRSKANSIEGGTSEVQLNVIAKRILGLPA